MELDMNSLRPEDQEMGFTLYNFEDVLVDNHEIAAQPQRNSFYQVAWVSSGNGITVVDGKHYPYGPNTVFIVQPGQVMYMLQNEGVHGTSICFNESFLVDDTHKENILLKYRILDAAYTQPYYQLDGTAAPIIRDLIEDIRTEYSQPPSVYGHHRALQYLFQIFLIIMQRTIPNFNRQSLDITNPNHNLYMRFRHLLEEKYKEGWKAWRYAKELGVSEKFCPVLFVRHRGRPLLPLLRNAPLPRRNACYNTPTCPFLPLRFLSEKWIRATSTLSSALLRAKLQAITVNVCRSNAFNNTY